jgi:hypothetical protein
MDRASMFTGLPYFPYEITIGATGLNIGALIADGLKSRGIHADTVLQVILSGKQTGGADRDAVLLGDTAANCIDFYGTGIEADPPTRGVGWFVKRSGGADVTAIARVFLAS